MTSLLRWAIAGGAMLLLAACSTLGNPSAVDLASARSATDTGSPFQKALHQEYVNLAGIEWTESDWGNARYFADRARASAAGQSFGPTEVASRRIAKARVQEVTDMRDHLITALGGDVTTRLAQPAARAQAMYDCWIEEVDESNQPEDEASCLNELRNALADIDRQRVAQVTPAPAAASAASPRRALPTQPYTIYFDFDKSDIRTSEKPTIDKIAADDHELKPQGIKIDGHTDRAGPATYNMVLSRKRTISVANGLAAQGVDRSKMTLEGFGETRPAFPTLDGVREQRNRRVEVTLQ